MLLKLAAAVFALCAVAQFSLYWGILAEHKPGRSRAGFALLKIPRRADLTDRGVELAKWWWRTTTIAAMAFVVVLVLRR